MTARPSTRPTALLLTGLALTVAAAPTRADAAGPRLEPVGPGRLCTADRALCVRGQLDATGTRLTGTVAVETKLGDWVLQNADLELDISRPMLRGVASVGMPQLGLLRNATSGRARASIHIGFGSDSELRLADRPFAPRADKFYIAAELQGAAAVSLGGATLFQMKNGTSLLFEPTTPMLYADGLVATALASMLQLGGLDRFGLSLDDRACIPYTTQNALLSDIGGKPAKRSACGNLLVSGELSYKLVSVHGTLYVDLDANGDGKTIFEGQPRDFIVVGEVTGAITVPKVQRVIELTRASMMFVAGVGQGGRLATAIANGRDLWMESTPLARFLGGNTVRTYFLADDTGVQGMFDTDQAILGGWKVAALRATAMFRETGHVYQLAGKLGLFDGAQVAVAGTVNGDGSFRLTAKQTLKLLDLELQNAAITLSNDGVAISADAGARGPEAKVSATLTTRRDPSTLGAAQPVTPERFALTGKATIELRGRKLGDGRLFVTPDRMRIKGTLSFAGAKFALDGTFGVRNYALSSSLKASGSKSVNFGVKKVKVRADGKAVLRISDDSFSVRFEGDLDPGGHEKLAINGDGEICQKIGVKVLGEKIGKKVCINVL